MTQITRRIFLAFVLGLAALGVAQAQTLTPAQLTTLRTDILADGALAPKCTAPVGDAPYEIAAAYNVAASPAHIVWRTNVTRAEIYHGTSAEGTTWNWTTYKNQGVAEQNAWTQMFMGDTANFALPNLRAGVAAIFTGSAQANAQRDHALATAKRAATRAEKLFATGTGSTAVPATMSFEGSLSVQAVLQACAGN